MDIEAPRKKKKILGFLGFFFSICHLKNARILEISQYLATLILPVISGLVMLSPVLIPAFSKNTIQNALLYRNRAATSDFPGCSQTSSAFST